MVRSNSTLVNQQLALMSQSASVASLTQISIKTTIINHHRALIRATHRRRNFEPNIPMSWKSIRIRCFYNKLSNHRKQTPRNSGERA